MTDLQKHSIEDLKKSVLEKREALRSFRFGGAGSRTRNVREGRTLRKEVARIFTELRSRELAPIKELQKQVVQAKKDVKKVANKTRV